MTEEPYATEEQWDLVLAETDREWAEVKGQEPLFDAEVRGGIVRITDKRDSRRRFQWNADSMLRRSDA